MTVLDYLKSLYAQSQQPPGSLPPPDASLYGDQTPMGASPGMQSASPQAPMQAPMPSMGTMPNPMSQVSVPGASAQTVADPAKPKGILDYLRDPGMAQTLLSMGANLLQSGGASDKPISTGQAIGSAANTGMSTYQGFQDRQEADAARKQQQAGTQWRDMTPAEIKAKFGPLGAPPGYVPQVNGNGEIRMPGVDVMKQGADASGNSVLQDIRKPQGAASSAAPGAIPGPYDPDTLHNAAIVVMSDPNRIKDYASYGKTGQAAKIQLQKAVTQEMVKAGMTAQDMVALRTRAHAETGNVATLTKQQAQLNAADTLIHNNGDRLLQLFDLVDDTGVPMIEGITRSAKAKLGGVDPAELTSVLTTFQTEVARMLSGNPNMTGVISDDMRNEIMKMAPGSMSTAQAKRIINRLYLETSVRQQAVNDQLNQGVQQTVVGGNPATAAPNSLKSMSNADLLKQLGVSGPNG